MLPILYMLVGLPGSGKSTLAEQLSRDKSAILCSSDAMRSELFQNESIQTENVTVFKYLHVKIKDLLRSGESVIYDATNISCKGRISFLNELKTIRCIKMCYVVVTPYDVCLLQNKQRKRQVPESVINKMYLNFDIPYYNEGWDQIKIHYINRYYYNIDKWLYVNKYYKKGLSLGNMPLGVYSEICARCVPLNTHCRNIHEAALLHNCGLSFVNSKEKHCCAGSYNSLFFNGLYIQTDEINSMSDYILYRAFLIRWCMLPANWSGKHDNSENIRIKYKDLLGDSLYFDLRILYEAINLAKKKVISEVYL